MKATRQADECARMPGTSFAIMEWIKAWLIPPRMRVKDPGQNRTATLADMSGQLLLPGIADPHRWDFGRKG